MFLHFGVFHSLKILRQPLLHYVFLSPTIISCTNRTWTELNGWVIIRETRVSCREQQKKKKKKSKEKKRKMTKDSQMRDRLVDHFIAINCIISVWAEMRISSAHLVLVRAHVLPKHCASTPFHSIAPMNTFRIRFHWISRVGFCILVLDFSWHSTHARHVFCCFYGHLRVQKSQILAQRKSPHIQTASLLHFVCFFSGDSILLLSVFHRMHNWDRRATNAKQLSVSDDARKLMLALCGPHVSMRKQEETDDSLNDCV